MSADEKAEATADLVGYAELMAETGMKYSRVYSKLHAVGTVVRGKLPPARTGRHWRTAFDREEALADLRREIQPHVDVPAPRADFVVDSWTPKPSKAVRDLSESTPRHGNCPFLAMPCRLSSSCSAGNIVRDGRGHGRLYAAELCLNYTVPATSGADGAQSCRKCGRVCTDRCEFDCFRVSRAKFIETAFSAPNGRRPAQKREMALCT